MAVDQGQEKTEQPTQRRFEKAAEEGQIAQSADFTAGLTVMIGAFFFFLTGAWLYTALSSAVKIGLSDSSIPLSGDVDMQKTTFGLVQAALWHLFLITSPLVLVTFGVVLLNGVAMTGMKMTWKPLTPNFEKLDPVKGFSKIFSSRAVVRGLLAVLKIAVMAAIVFWLLSATRGKIGATTGQNIGMVISTGWELTLQVTLAIAAAMLIVGLVDLLFQKWKHVQDLKMTKQELRDEMKEMEGDPHLRARIRKLQREVANRTMLNDVKNADVVITNPTHLSIALRFDRAKDNAPIVLAKGADQLAMKIREIAKKNRVPVIERKPVARALYGLVEVGDEIPLELYQAVAEILAYVSRHQSIVRR